MKISGKSKEVLGVIAVLLGIVVLQRDLWVTGKHMLSHDSIIWFGAFSYFADCLHRGIMPLWNPYMNCGEIFFLNMHILNLLEPSTLLLVLSGDFLKINMLTIYHYDLLFRYLFFISGSYLFFRLVAKYRFSAFVAFMTLSFSALCSSYLKQHAFILSFYLLPWILLFTFKFLEERNSISLVWLAFFWGVALSSYHAMFLIVSVVLLLICFFLSKGFTFLKKGGFLKERKFVSAAVLIFLLLSVNLLSVFWSYTRDTIPTVRLFEAPYPAYSYPADFSNLFTPYSFIIHFFNWFYMSESFLYIGLIPLFFAIVGLFYSRHRYRTGFALTALIIALLMLGPRFIVSSLFSNFFPFFKAIRNTHTFGTFFIFCLACLVCLGVDTVTELAENSALGRYRKKFILIVVVISEIVFLINNNMLINYEPALRQFQAHCDNPSLLVGQNFVTPPKEIFFWSYYNVFLFIASITIILIMIGRPKVGLKSRYFAIISLILVDLVIFNLKIYKFEVGERIDISLWPRDGISYSNYRITMIKPEYPFYGFAPAMQRKFTAVSTEIPWVTTHFYEMKDFFNFATDKRIPPEIKKIFMGISAPKIKLVGGAVVLPPALQAQELSKLDHEEADNTVFVEEGLPPQFADLTVSIKDIGRTKPAFGKIDMMEFDPNNVLLEVDAGQDSLLYYSDGFDRSWRAFIDGKETKIYRTNAAFKSVIVEKGKHSVRFEYDPRLYKVTLFCYFAGIITAGTTFIYAAFKRKTGAWKN